MCCKLRLHATQHTSLIPTPTSPLHCVLLVSCSCARPVSHAVLIRQAIGGTAICASHCCCCCCCSKEAVLVSHRSAATCRAMLAAAAAACRRLRPAGPACALAAAAHAAELAREAVEEGLLSGKLVANLVSVCLQGMQACSRSAHKTVQQSSL